MNTLKITMPYEFASKLVDLTWFDMIFAIEQEFLSNHAAVEHSLNEIANCEDPLQGVVDIAFLSEGESIHPYIDELASIEPNKDELSRRNKFLYLLLSWVYEYKELFDDPLEVVEYIYADFNYPTNMEDFIRYMPTNQADLGSKELNRERLYKNWRNFLHAQQIEYAKSKDTA